MGQEITVTARPGASPRVRIFDCNRSITGMAIERYASADETSRGRAPDVLAHRLFELGAESVTVYSNDVIVEAAPEAWPDLEPKITEAIEHLFEFYGQEAGWSDDALRAIGVQPLPRPEPSA